MITSKLTSKAQTTIPRAVRRHLDVAEGDLLGFVLEGGRVMLCKPLLRTEPPRLPVAASPPALPVAMAEWESEADKRAFHGL